MQSAGHVIKVFLNRPIWPAKNDIAIGQVLATAT
jgi:hypothetical protein